MGLLVMSPTRELAQQIEDKANRFGQALGMWSALGTCESLSEETL